MPAMEAAFTMGRYSGRDEAASARGPLELAEAFSSDPEGRKPLSELIAEDTSEGRSVASPVLLAHSWLT